MLEALILYLLNRKIDDKDDKHIGIRKDTYVNFNHQNDYYIIPTIRITKTGKYLEIMMFFINMEYYICYNLVKESDEP